MRKISAIAFLTALVLTGCGDSASGASSAATFNGSASEIKIAKDRQEFSTETVFVDEDGTVTSRISDIKSSATGVTPPKAPDVGGKSQEFPEIGMR